MSNILRSSNGNGFGFVELNNSRLYLILVELVVILMLFGTLRWNAIRLSNDRAVLLVGGNFVFNRALETGI